MNASAITSAVRHFGPLLRGLAVPVLLVATVSVPSSGARAADVALTVSKGPSAGQVTLSWVGSAPSYLVYRGVDPATVADPGNLLGQTTAQQWVDAPPDVALVDYLVSTPPSPVCGNGVRETGEQCDDGNVIALDGCSPACQFEQAQRANYFKMQFLTDVTCTRNALGGAFVNTSVQGTLQSRLDSGVADGSLSLVLAMIGEHDLTGVSDASFDVGFLTATPVTSGASGPYDGTSDLDWWHDIDARTIDGSRQPLFTLPASIAGGAMSAGPGTAFLPPILGGSAPMRMASTQLRVTTGSSSAPLVSTGGPPGHLAQEHLDPSLSSYAACGQPNANGAGHLCGRITAQSLAASLLPSWILQTCTSYTTANSMLDLVVGGCTTIIVQVVRPTQPDSVDDSAPAAGAGGPYVLSADAHKIVTTCKDKNGATVDLNTCLASAAYSSFFKIATDRVIPK